MVSERAVLGTLVLGVTVGLGLVVYGMWLSSGQSWNPPSFAGGIVILVAVAVMAARVAGIEEPAH